jgi:hypothetical protein
MKKYVSVLGRVRSILGISVLNAVSKKAGHDEESDAAAPVRPRLHYATNFVKLLAQ